MQPWLLQHYAGTPGVRIERMLTRLVAEKFTDHSGIDWAEIVSQHKELVGHTATSLGQAHQKVLFSKCQSRCLSARQREEEVSCWRRAQRSSNFTLKGKAAEFGVNVELWSWDNLLVLNLYRNCFCLETEEEKDWFWVLFHDLHYAWYLTAIQYTTYFAGYFL